ncbi:MAG: DNA adenine methylase [Methylophilus sp.]|uniref:DNA adenine methylase n=1 Tax=Methylophilus sp. TaxID=29541 RepID=UPI003FA06669
MAGNSNPLTPLRYPGGKSSFAPYVKSIIENNNLRGGVYMEPYAGGAAVGLDLLFNDICERIVINDLDLGIYNFWKSITDMSEHFLELLKETPVTIDQWYIQKNILSAPENYTSLEHGFATFFLNRTNRSGIIKGGVIGGKAQSGDYKLDARFNKEGLEKRIKRVASFSSRIEVCNMDAVDLIFTKASVLPENALIYLDPPYYVKGKGLYRNYYDHNDHVQIRDALNNLNKAWLVSYDSCPEIKKIYSDYHQVEYGLSYCAHQKVKGSEVIIFSKNITPAS